MKNESAAHEAISDQWFSTEIYFGRNIPAGGEVSEQQFADFLSNEITPKFPAGMTVYDAYGQMQHHHRGIVKQKTKVVILVHKNSKTDDASINTILAAYRSTFGNPQIMMLTKQLNSILFKD